MNTPKNMKTDHINGDGLDNRRSNLRVCTNQQNQFNRGPNKNNTSGYKGVVFLRGLIRGKYIKHKPWQARARVGGKTYSFGVYATPEEASIAYQNGVKELHGEFAHV